MVGASYLIFVTLVIILMPAIQAEAVRTPMEPAGLNGSVSALTWTVSVSNFPFRRGSSLLSLNSKIYAIGGRENIGGESNDILATVDGLTWAPLNIVAPIFAPRVFTSVLVFKSKMLLVAGENGTSRFNDVWISKLPGDLTRWQGYMNRPFVPRKGHSCFVLSNKVWMAGGSNKSNVLADVWNSGDGVKWVAVPPPANASNRFPGRYSFTFVVFKHFVWLIGGESSSGLKNDIWRSKDGRNWILAVPTAPFQPRWYFGTVVFNQKLWVLGGSGANEWATAFGDVWSSADGVGWTQRTDLPAPRAKFGLVVANATVLWLVGGYHTNQTYGTDVVSLAVQNCMGMWVNSSCSRSCGGGKIRSTFQIRTIALNEGKACAHRNGSSRSYRCNTNPCA